MQQDPPLAVDVGKEAIDDIKRNFISVQEIIYPVLPVLALLCFADIIGQTYLINSDGVPTAAYNTLSLIVFFISAWVAVHYVLRWHLHTLKGSVANNGTWFHPNDDYKNFFFKALILQMVVILAIFVPLTFFTILPAPVALIVNIICWCFGIYAVTRLSFILPATVLGHTPSIKEIWDFADGMVGRTIWAPIRASMKYVLAYLIYLIIAGMIIGFISAVTGIVIKGAVFNIMVFIFIGIPGIALTIFFSLVYVGVLSRYYLWGLKNRTDAYGDFK